MDSQDLEHCNQPQENQASSLAHEQEMQDLEQETHSFKSSRQSRSRRRLMRNFLPYRPSPTFLASHELFHYSEIDEEIYDRYPKISTAVAMVKAYKYWPFYITDETLLPSNEVDATEHLVKKMEKINLTSNPDVLKIPDHQQLPKQLFHSSPHKKIPSKGLTVIARKVLRHKKLCRPIHMHTGHDGCASKVKNRRECVYCIQMKSCPWCSLDPFEKHLVSEVLTSERWVL